MPNPAENPIEYVNQAALNPGDPTLPATPAALAAIDAELLRLTDRSDRLKEARSNIVVRMAQRFL